MGSVHLTHMEIILSQAGQQHKPHLQLPPTVKWTGGVTNPGTYLWTYCGRKQQRWSEFLPWTEYVHNSLTRSSSGLTSFQCILEYEPPMFLWSGEPSEVPALIGFTGSKRYGTAHIYASNKRSAASTFRSTKGDLFIISHCYSMPLSSNWPSLTIPTSQQPQTATAPINRQNHCLYGPLHPWLQTKERPLTVFDRLGGL